MTHETPQDSVRVSDEQMLTLLRRIVGEEFAKSNPINREAFSDIVWTNRISIMALMMDGFKFQNGRAPEIVALQDGGYSS